MASRFTSILVASTALLLAAPVAGATEAITLRDQKVVKGDVIEVLEGALRVRTAGDTIVTLQFGHVAATSLYELLRKRVTATDPKARLALADKLQRYSAFDQARQELDAALAIDTKLAATVQKRRKALDDVQAQSLYNHGLEQMLAGKWTVALDAFRTIADRFAETQWAPKAIQQSERAVAGLEASEQAGGAAGPRAPRTPKRRLTLAEKKAELKQARIAYALEEAAKAIKKADELNRQGLADDGKGKISSAKRAYEQALEQDARAKGFLGKKAGVQRVATDLAVLEDAQKRIEQINKHMVLVHLNAASLLMKERNFKGARRHVTDALKIDPMNKRALELKQEIAKHSINRKVSDLTNARGRVTQGGR